MPGKLNHSMADVGAALVVALNEGTDPEANDPLGWPVYAGEEADKPDNLITVDDTVGRLGGRTMPDSERDERQGIQVRVRSARSPVGWLKAAGIAHALDTEVYDLAVTVDGGKPEQATYLIHSASRGSVIALGRDPNSNRYLFTINVLLAVRMR